MRKQRLILLLKKMAPVVIAGAVLLLLAVIGYGVPCLFRTITGVDCPGCGGTRMALALLRLDFSEAIAYNPVLFFSMIVLGAAWVVTPLRYLRTGSWRFTRCQNVIFVGLIVVILGAWLFRTLSVVAKSFDFF